MNQSPALKHFHYLAYALPYLRTGPAVSIATGFRDLADCHVSFEKIGAYKILGGQKEESGTPVIIKKKSKFLFTNLDPLFQYVSPFSR
jgi:hypothetical protein